MKDIIDELAKWGCDIPSALERFDGDKDLYKECLKIFASDENFDGLKKNMADKNVEEAFKSAHALKGVAGNLSLGILYKNICTVSDSLKAGDFATAEANYPELEKAKKEYDKIIAE
jgi:HPt (histidine-containing phosphotransfer) domain-containing protein